LIVRGETSAKLEKSDDGVTWNEIDSPFTGDVPSWWVTPLVAPDSGLPPWLVVVQDIDLLNDPGQPPPSSATYSSIDLVEWQTGVIPRSFVSQVVATPVGFIADALNACRTTGPENLPCPPEDQRQYLADDGTAWQELSALTGTLKVAHGPAGVLAVDIISGRVWRLDPRSDA
jgi:hypothetical protein